MTLTPSISTTISTLAASTTASPGPNTTRKGYRLRISAAFQVDLFIEQLSAALRDFNLQTGRLVQLGISPTGIYRNGSYIDNYVYDDNGNLISPSGSNTSGFAHYGDYLYCDTKMDRQRMD